MSSVDPVIGTSGTSLPDLLALERIEGDLFRTVLVSPEPCDLFGGQVAAQALHAAAATVPDGRLPHSLHGYFLSRGDSSRRVLLQVSSDGDGRSYSNRRVVVMQDGRVIFNMAASFHVAEDGPAYQAQAMPLVEPPDGLPDAARRLPVLGVQIRIPSQPQDGQQKPSRLWIRATHQLDGDLANACALVYVSDIFTGHAAVPGIVINGPFTSIDHAMWLHRRTVASDWLLISLQPEAGGGGRATYTGRIFSRDGTLCAAIAQETLFRPSDVRLTVAEPLGAG